MSNKFHPDPARRFDPSTLEGADALRAYEEQVYRRSAQKTIDDQAEAERREEQKLAEWGIGSF
jgi:hypothetical protein